MRAHGTWELFLKDDGNLSFGVGVNLVTTQRALTFDEWHHVAAVARPSATNTTLEIEIYVNGVVAASAEFSGKIQSFSLVQCGAEGRMALPDPTPAAALAESPKIAAVFDEIRIWNIAKQVFEVDQGRYHHMRPDRTGLCAQVSFDGKDASDTSAHKAKVTTDEPLNFVDPFVHWVPEGQPYVLTKSRLIEDRDNELKSKPVFFATLSLRSADGTQHGPIYETRKRTEDGKTYEDEIPLPTVHITGPSGMQVVGQGNGEDGWYTPDDHGDLQLLLPTESKLHCTPIRVRTYFMDSSESLIVSPDRDLHHRLRHVSEEQIGEIANLQDTEEQEAVARAVRELAAPIADHSVEQPGEQARAVQNNASGWSSRTSNKQHYVPREEPCPCCDRGTGISKTFHAPAEPAEEVQRIVSTSVTGCQHWRLNLSGKIEFEELSEDEFENEVVNAPRFAASLLGSSGKWFEDFKNGTLKGVKTVAVRTLSPVEVELWVNNDHVALQKLEDMADVIAGLLHQVLKEAAKTIQHTAELVLEKLCIKLSWLPESPIAKVQHQICRLLREGYESYDTTMTEVANEVGDELQKLYDSLEQPFDDTGSSADSVHRSARNDLADVLQLVMESPEAKWLMHKIQRLEDELPDLYALWKNLGLEDPPWPPSATVPEFLGDGRWLLDLADDSMQTLMGDGDGTGVSRLDSGSVANAGRDVFRNLLERLIEQDTLPKAIKEPTPMLNWFVTQLIDKPLPIPIAGKLLGSNGKDATVLEVVAGLIAVPLWAASNALFGRDPNLEAETDSESANLSEFKDLVLAECVLKLTFAVADTYVDQRTIRKRPTLPSRELVGERAHWRAKNPASLIIGHTSFWTTMLAPLMVLSLDATINRQHHEQLYELEENEKLLRLAGYGGVLRFPWLIYKWPYLALKCGVYDTYKFADLADPSEVRFKPEPDSLGPVGTAIFGVVQLLFWWAKSDLVVGADAKRNARFTGVANLVACSSKLWVKYWKGSKLPSATAKNLYWGSFAALRAAGSASLAGLTVRRRMGNTPFFDTD